MDLKAFSKFCASLAPEDEKKFHELLETRGSIEDLNKKIGNLNKEYLKTYKECSNIICFEIDARTNWGGEKINRIYNVPFIKICAEYDSINEDIKLKFKGWDEGQAYSSEIFSIIDKKGKTAKVIKGISLLLDNHRKEMSEKLEYHDKITVMYGKMKKFRQELAVFIN